ATRQHTSATISTIRIQDFTSSTRYSSSLPDLSPLGKSERFASRVSERPFLCGLTLFRNGFSRAANANHCCSYYENVNNNATECSTLALSRQKPTAPSTPCREKIG